MGKNLSLFRTQNFIYEGPGYDILSTCLPTHKMGG